jgi:hypothetical protein
VGALWGADVGGWGVEAFSVAHPIGWRDGGQVLSR